MLPTAQVHVDRSWLLLLGDAGIDATSVLRRASLPGDLLHRHDGKLTTQEFFRFWEAIEAEADDPAFVVRLADAMSLDVFHPAWFAATCSPDLRVAARRLGQYKRLVAPIAIDTADDDRGLFIGVRWNDPQIECPPSFAASELAFMVRIARVATRTDIRPVRIESPLDLSGITALESWFGRRFERSERHGATFTAEDAARPFLTENPALWAIFEPDLRRRLTELDASASLADRVRAVLLECLPSGESGIAAVSDRLGLSPRTLQRRLKASGTSYRAIVNETREQLAHHYLGNSDLAYAEISFLVGFEETSSFFRAFREWTGTTPEDARLALTAH